MMLYPRADMTASELYHSIHHLFQDFLSGKAQEKLLLLHDIFLYCKRLCLELAG